MTFLRIFLVLTFCKYILATDYCSDNMKCDGVENSGCNCDFGPKCKGAKEHKMTDEIRKSILQVHNKYRDKVASGKESRGGIKGGASDMYALQYNKELEHTASCWNKKCTFGHDQCRITEKFRPAGQNLYWSSGKACNWDYNLEEATRLWYEEVKDMTSSCLASYANGCVTSKVGHFGQMIWAQTTHIGCSLVEYGGSCQVACNYGPAGNFQSEPVFTPGAPAGKCKFRSTLYDSLCLLSEDQEQKEHVAEKSNTQPQHFDKNPPPPPPPTRKVIGSKKRKSDADESSDGVVIIRNQFIVCLTCFLISFHMLLF